MIITAKFSSACQQCGRQILVGDRIQYTPGVRTVSHAVCSAEGQALAVKVAESRKVDANIALPCPDGLEYYGFQRAGIAFALGRRSTLFADEMGLGKTVQAIGTVNASPEIKRVLVIAPASLSLNWRREIQTWDTRGASVQMHGRKPVTVRTPHYDIVTYGVVKSIDAAIQYDCVILDEIHYCKEPKSARTQAVQALVRRCKARVLALTGTPVPNRVREIFPILQMIDAETWDPAGTVQKKENGQKVRVAVGPGEGAGFFRFATRYCDAKTEWHGRTKHWSCEGASNLAELQERLRSTCMVRRLKRDVLAELPPKRRHVVMIGNGCDDSDLAGDWGDFDDLDRAQARVAKIPFEEISTRRHEQALRKIPAAIEHIENALVTGEKVIVFAHHLDVIEALTVGLAAHGVVRVIGEMSKTERQESVDRFQSDPACKVFIGSLKAAGVGWTLTASSHVIFVEIDWTPAVLTQAEDRAHRIGQTESVLVETLMLEGSLDARMAELLVQKQNVADLTLDTDTFLDPSGREIVLSPAEKRARRLVEASLTEEQVTQIHRALIYLSNRCDGATAQDGAGFNRLDSPFGKALAAEERLSAGQAIAARKVLRKYVRQLEQGGIVL